MTLPRFAARVDSSPVLRVELPWPDKRLSPNSRTHWRARIQVIRSARHAAKMLCMQAMGTQGWAGCQRPTVRYTFCPPTRQPRDLDNLIAAHKSANDGLADALRINDREFQLAYSMGEPVKGGMVIVEIGV